MISKICGTALVTAICLSAAAPAYAQDQAGNDWQLRHFPRQKATMAVAEFDNGLTLVTRCVDYAFDVLIAGLPETGETSRLLQVGVGEDSRMRNVVWLTAADRTSAFSHYPMTIARDLMRGGTIRIRIPGQNGGPSTLYVMETEPSVSAIGETLTACGKPLIDPRQTRDTDETLADLPFDVEWVELPMPPPRAFNGISNLQSTTVTISCLTAEGGRLNDCHIESAHPHNPSINRAMLAAARRGRLRHKTGEPVSAGREIGYRLNFKAD